MNSSLTPEKRPDKNGKLVTRHVRTGGTDSASGRGIPAPGPVIKERTVEQAANELLDTLEQATGDGRLDGSYRGWYLQELKKIPSTKVFDLAMECAANPLTAKFVPEFVKEATNRNMDGHELDRLLTVYFSGVELHEKMRAYSAMYNYSNAEQTLYYTYSTMGFANMKQYDDGITEDHIKYLKSSLLLEMKGVKLSNFTLPHEYYGVLSKVKENWDSIERHAQVLSASEINKYDPLLGDEIVNTCAMVDESGIEPDDMADFMKEHGINSVPRALEMMSTSSKPLYSGVL